MKIEYRHSASKTNTFIDSPPFWIINELFGFESEPNARMVMGLAAEDAAHHALSNQITDQDSITDYSVRKYIEHILKISKTKDDVVRIFPLVCDNFRWKGSLGSVEFAKDIWTKALK